MKNYIAAFVCGHLLALSLGLGELTRPDRIIGALDITGRWDPTMPLFFLSAVVVYHIIYRLTLRQSAPVFDHQFHLPTRTRIDVRLIGGAMLFGVGWGLGGICPGPALTALGSGQTTFIVFFAAMVLGMYIFDLYPTIMGRFRPKTQTTAPG